MAIGHRGGVLCSSRRSFSTGAVLCLFASGLLAQRDVEQLIQAAPAHLRAGLPGDRRAVRRDVPLTRTIRKGLEAGTRSLDGRPGPNYWQLRTDFDLSLIHI